MEIELKEIFHKMKLNTTAKSRLLNNFQKKSNAYFINNTISFYLLLHLAYLLDYYNTTKILIYRCCHIGHNKI